MNYDLDLKRAQKIAELARFLSPEEAFNACAFRLSEDRKTLLNVDNFYICGELKIPEGIEYINPLAFYGCDRLTEIILPSTLKAIPKNCFSSCENLNKVIFKSDSKLETIEACAFKGCKNLKEIKLPKSLLIIDDFAFVDTSITELNIPENVISIGSGICSTCNQLKKITVSKNNTRFSDMNCNIIYINGTEELLQGCATSTIPENTVFIRESSFQNIKLEQNIINNNNIKFIDKNAFYNSNIKEINSKGLVGICESALCNCIDLQKLNFGDKLKYIEENALERTNIKEMVFDKNINLHNFDFNNIAYSDINAFIFQDAKTLMFENNGKSEILEDIIKIFPYSDIIVENIENYPKYYKEYKNRLTPSIEYYSENKSFNELNKMFNDRNTNEYTQETLER